MKYRVRITARRSGAVVLIRYFLTPASCEALKRPAAVYVSVHAESKRLLPSGRWVRPSAHTGLVRVSVPYGAAGPLRAKATLRWADNSPAGPLSVVRVR
jgi:hypothetical protein